MKKLLVAAMLASIVSTSALASPGDSPQRRMQFIDNAGTLHELDVHNMEEIAMFKQHARELPRGTLVMTVDGSIYVLQDEKMPDGHMMSETLMN